MKKWLLEAVIFLGALLFTMSVAYLRIDNTMTGYKIGDIKDRESRLLEAQSRLKMELAKLTRKENLTALAKSDEDSPKTKTLAAY